MYSNEVDLDLIFFISFTVRQSTKYVDEDAQTSEVIETANENRKFIQNASFQLLLWYIFLKSETEINADDTQ